MHASMLRPLGYHFNVFLVLFYHDASLIFVVKVMSCLVLIDVVQSPLLALLASCLIPFMLTCFGCGHACFRLTLVCFRTVLVCLGHSLLCFV